MADDKSKPGAPDRKLINLSEDHEVRGWCTKFGVTEAELRKAVWKVGHDASKVEVTLPRFHVHQAMPLSIWTPR